MIGYLKGKILFKEEDCLIVEASNIGWQVYVPVHILHRAKREKEIELFVYTQMREDTLKLFGLPSIEDKKIFQQLMSVSGIGANLALAVISYSVDCRKIIKAIQTADVEFFKAVKGVGKKSAQRIIVDLKGKVGSVKELEFERETDKDLVEALEGLGFSNKEIKEAIKGIDEELTLEEKIKKALSKQ